MQQEEAQLRGPPEPFGRTGWLILILLVLAGFALRVHALAAEGFGDDEVHKWLAANRYLHGVFSGDDVEHPMLMKWLITAVLAVAPHWAPEAIVRLPNVVAGSISILVVGLLGKRLFGRRAGLIAAGLAAFSTTYIGYHRVAKEDTLLGLFLMLVLLCMAEARARPTERRWEIYGALSLAGMLASKYFFFLLPIPFIFYWTQKDWHIPPRRWAQMAGIAFVAWCAVNWSPFLPSTWEYAKSYTTGQQTVHGSLFFMGRIYHNLVEYGLKGTPPWFYAVFAAVKLTPITFAAALVGLYFVIRERRPADKLLLTWMAVWFVVHSASGSKWGRFFVSVMPAFLILAGYAASRIKLATVAVAAELAVALIHAPHYRLYASVGDVQYFFPHCDYFDAGFREAVQWVNAHAEHGAELSTEIDWPAKLYGRDDFKYTLVRRGQVCRSDAPCYVVTQVGRLYFLNEDAVRWLATQTPVHVESIEGKPVVRVYKLDRSPFPDERTDQHAAQN